MKKLSEPIVFLSFVLNLYKIFNKKLSDLQMGHFKAKEFVSWRSQGIQVKYS